MAISRFALPVEAPSLDQFLTDAIDRAVDAAFERHTAPEPTLTVNVNQAAHELNVSIETVRRLILDGHLPTVDMGTNRHIIPRRALEAYVNGPT